VIRSIRHSVVLCELRISDVIFGRLRAVVGKQAKKYVLSMRRSVAMLTPKLVVNVNMSIMDLYSAESQSISTALSL